MKLLLALSITLNIYQAVHASEVQVIPESKLNEAYDRLNAQAERDGDYELDHYEVCAFEFNGELKAGKCIVRKETK